MARERHARRPHRISVIGAFAAALLLATAGASAQTKIAKAKSISAMVQVPDGRMLVFCGSENYRTDTMYASTDATGKTWEKPVKIPRFGAAVAGPDGNVYIAAFDNRKYVLDALVKGKDGGWELKPNVATILDTNPKGSILGPTVTLTVQGGQLWAACAWREDQGTGGGRTASLIHFVVAASPMGNWKFQQSWEDKDGAIANYAASTIGIWNGKPVIYVPQHYVATVITCNGQTWKLLDKVFDLAKGNGGWVGGYGAPQPQTGCTANGFLHVAQWAHGDASNGGLLLETLTDKGVASFLDLGGKEARNQFVTVVGNDVLIGIQSDVVQRIDDMEKKYQALTVMRCTPGTGGLYKKTDQELMVTETETNKGGMAAPPTIAAGKPLPVAYIDEGKLYITMLEVK